MSVLATRMKKRLKLSENVRKSSIFQQTRKKIVAIGRNVLSIHVLKPYQQESKDDSTTGWDAFRQSIFQVFDKYQELNDSKRPNQISIRYINKITLPTLDSNQIKKFLNIEIAKLDSLPTKTNNFQSRAEYSYEDGARVVLIHGLLNESTGSERELLLDINVIRSSSDSFEQSKILEIVEDLRDRERDVFESLITEEARKLFDAI